MNETADCPIDHETITTPHASWLEASAQAILDGEDIGDALGGLKTRLESSYELMAQNRPGKAAENVARKVRAAYIGAVSHIYVGRMVTLVNDSRQNDTLEVLLDNARHDSLDVTTSIYDETYCGEAFAYMESMVSLTDASVDSLIDDTHTPSGQLFRRLEKFGPEIYTLTREAARVSDNPEWGDYWNKYRTFSSDLCAIIVENARISLELMLAAQIALAKTGIKLTPNEIGNVVRDNIDLLASFASTNKSLIKQQDLFRDHSGRSEYIFQYDGKDLDRLGQILDFDGSRLVARHRSLANGPWRSPGNCPANFRLRIVDTEIADAADSFFTAYGLDQHADGRFLPNAGYLAVSNLVAERTIFRPDPQTPAFLLGAMALEQPKAEAELIFA